MQTIKQLMVGGSTFRFTLFVTNCLYSTVSSTEPDSKMKFTIKKGSNWPGDKTF